MRRWHLLVVLAGLLLLRAGIYWQIGSATKPVWAGTLNLGVVVPAFVSNSFLRMALFSCLSFGVTLGVYYLWLLFLSIVAGADPPPFHRLVRMQLGGIDGWPRWLKWCLPPLLTAGCWWLASWPLAGLQVIPPLISPAHRLEEALVIGLGSYLAWKYIAGVLLTLHLLNTYIYFGKHPIWDCVNATARNLLAPLHLVPLRVGRVDFAPVVGIVLVFLLAELGGRGLAVLYEKLPF